ncbi:MAG: pyridoxal 5'-phosphate synthase [Acidimicrobiales bacterium]
MSTSPPANAEPLSAGPSSGDRLSFGPSWGLDDPPGEPLGLFRYWMQRAEEVGVLYPAAVSLATAGADARPSLRTVILKQWQSGCLVFETQSYSRKGTELSSNPFAALALYWREVHRQVVVGGSVQVMPADLSDEMWARRLRPNQAAAVASTEGATLAGVEEERALQGRADLVAASPGAIPRPPTYQAHGLFPETVEFWEGSPDRLHRRVFYERSSSGAWSWRRIQP